MRPAMDKTAFTVCKITNALGIKSWRYTLFMNLTFSRSTFLFLCSLIISLPGVNGEDLESTLYSTNQLLRVEIRMDKEDWGKLARQGRNIQEALSDERLAGKFNKPYTYYPGKVTINGKTFKNVGIRKKGFIGSLDSQRPSLKIKLNYEDKHQSIGDVTHLTLNNCKQDKSLVNQYLTYTIFRMADAPAPRCTYAHVTVNGENLGIYANVESMKKPMVEHHFGSDDGVLYEGTVVDFFSGWEDSFERKFGSKKKGKAVISGIVDALNESDSKKLLKSIEHNLDLDAFIQFWATEGIVGLPDGFSGNANNYFFYIHHDSEKALFIPWGADYAFTNRSLFFNFRRCNSVRTSSRLPAKLYGIPSIREKYRKTLIQILDKAWNEEFLAQEIERVEKIFAPHVHQRQRNYLYSLNKTRRFIRERRENIMEEIAEGMPEFRLREKQPIIFKTVGHIKGNFSAVYLEKEPQNDDWIGIGAQNLKVDLFDKPLDFEKSGLYVARARGKGRTTLYMKFSKPNTVRDSLISFSLSSRYLENPPDDWFSITGKFKEIGGFFLGRKSASFLGEIKINKIEVNDENERIIRGEIDGRFQKMKNGI